MRRSVRKGCLTQPATAWAASTPQEGTFLLQIDADDNAKYVVVVCDGEGPNGGNRDNPG